MLAVRRVRDLHIDPTTHPRRHTHLSAASGLVRVHERLYVVADDEHHLAMFDPTPEVPGRLIRLFEGDLPEGRLGQSAAPAEATALQHYDLGAVEGTPLGFTDGAALPDGAWVFSAVAESVDDSYNDGACVGASIGVVDAAGTLRSMRALAPTFKVEGIAAHLDGDALALTMVTDADDPAIPSQLLSARWVFSDALGSAPV